MDETRVQRRERERREAARREAARDRREAVRDQRDTAHREAVRRERIEREIDRELELENKRKRVRKKKRRRNVGGIIALIIILLVAFTLLRVWLETRPGAAEPIVMTGSGEFLDSGRVNILFLGTNQGLSDTIMVFSYDIGNNRLDEISIPRDTYYYRPAYAGAAYQKVNSVYSTEDYMGACRAASDILGGIPIHYYAVLDPEGVKKIVDSVGGVVINVPMDMKYVDEKQGLYIDLKAGTQLLNGEQAMQYLRYRSGYPNADLGRVSAQQEFLNAVISQSGALDFPKLALTVGSVTKTNMSLTTGAGLAAKAAGMDGGSFYTHTIPGSSGMQDGLSYFFHDAAGTKELMRRIYASE